MADYWKSLDKKYCDTCKCWLADNKASIEFHENGKRHKENVQKRLKEIHKRNKAEGKQEKKFEYDLKKIEKAAQAAMQKDMEANPDMSMKLQQYYDKLKAEAGPDESDSSASATASSSSRSDQPKISHRSEKERKADEAKIAQMNKPKLPYNRLGGWQSVQNDTNLDLELPASATAHQFVAKQPEKRKPITFSEKSVSSLTPSSSSTSGIITSGFAPVKTEPDVAFKKRKVARSNMRRREDD